MKAEVIKEVKYLVSAVAMFVGGSFALAVVIDFVKKGSLFWM